MFRWWLLLSLGISSTSTASPTCDVVDLMQQWRNQRKINATLNMQQEAQGQDNQQDAQGQDHQQQAQGQEHQQEAQSQEHQQGAQGQDHQQEAQSQDHQQEAQGQDHQQEAQGQEHQQEAQGQEHQQQAQGQEHQQEAQGQEHQQEAQSQDHQQEAQGQEHQQEAQSQEHQQEAQGQEHQQEAQSQEHQQEAQGQEHQQEAQGQDHQQEVQSQEHQQDAQGQDHQQEAQSQDHQQEAQGQEHQQEAQGQGQGTQGQDHQQEAQSQDHQQEAQGQDHQEAQSQDHQQEAQGQEHQQEAQGQGHQQEVQGQDHQQEAQGQDHQQEAQGQDHQQEAQGQDHQQEAQGQDHQQEAQGQDHQQEAQGQDHQQEAQGQDHQQEAQGQDLQQEEEVVDLGDVEHLNKSMSLGQAVTEFLVWNHSTTAALQELARKLVHAKLECLNSGLDCLPTLKQIRYRVWPFVQSLLGNQYQGFDPVDFHPQVAKAQMRCSAEEHHNMVYMHVWKAAGYSVMENLKSISSAYKVVDSFEDDFNWCENINLESMKQRTVFTFVREPLGRFISGYAEIDRIYQGPRYEFFHQANEGSMKRAQLFAERFFQDGLIFNGHVKPQSEYFAPFYPTCQLPINFVGKIENLAEDWKQLLESRSCIKANIPFNNSLGQHPTDEKERKAMTDMLESVNNAKFLVKDRNRDNMTKSSKVHLRNVLLKQDFAFLRAFCWISLPDYVMFEYDLPKQCNDPSMLKVIEMAKKIPLI